MVKMEDAEQVKNRQSCEYITNTETHFFLAPPLTSRSQFILEAPYWHQWENRLISTTNNLSRPNPSARSVLVSTFILTRFRWDLITQTNASGAPELTSNHMPLGISSRYAFVWIWDRCWQRRRVRVLSLTEGRAFSVHTFEQFNEQRTIKLRVMSAHSQVLFATSARV